jgi:hypothetical protein
VLRRYIAKSARRVKRLAAKERNKQGKVFFFVNKKEAKKTLLI